MLRCQDCRWWECGQTVTVTVPRATSVVQGACTRFGSSLAQAQPYRAVDVPGWETTQAYIAIDADSALFMTQSDFGCVQGERRSDA